MPEMKCDHYQFALQPPIRGLKALTFFEGRSRLAQILSERGRRPQPILVSDNQKNYSFVQYRNKMSAVCSLVLLQSMHVLERPALVQTDRITTPKNTRALLSGDVITG